MLSLSDILSSFSSKKLILIIATVGFLVYANALFNGFVWDDEEQIVLNPLVQNLGNFPQLFSSSTFNSGGANPTGWFYRPMMTLSYLLNYSLWGNNAFGFHLFQILFHLTNASLVFLIFNRLFEKESLSKGKLFSFLAGLIFAIHPATVEAVSYIAALQEVLYTFFILLVIFLLLSQEHTKEKFKLFTAVSFFSLLALLSKEAAIFLLPLVFIFIFLYQKKNLLKFSFSFLGTFLTYALMRFGVAKITFSSPDVGPVAEASLYERLITIPYEIISYLRIIVFPRDLYICQHTLINNFNDFRFFGSLFLLAPVLVISLWFLVTKKSKIFFFFSFWFAGSLGMVLNIIPLDMTVAERWLYFPFIGFLGMLMVLSQAAIINRQKYLKTVEVILLFCLILLAARTVVRNSNWHDGYTLYSHDIQLNPGAFDLQNNYGVELFRRGEYEKAKEHFEQSIKLYPRWWFAYNNLGAVYQREGNLNKAKELYGKTLEISDYYLAYENLAFLMLQTATPQEAVEFSKIAVSKLPQNSKLRLSLALAYYKDGNYAEAEKYSQQAYFLNPSKENQDIFQAILARKEIFE